MIVPGKNETRLDRIIQAISELALGGSNALGRSAVTLATDADETVVTDPLCAPGALVVTVPLSAASASAGLYLKSTGRGTFTLGHTLSDAERLVRYELRRP